MTLPQNPAVPLRTLELLEDLGGEEDADSCLLDFKEKHPCSILFPECGGLLKSPLRSRTPREQNLSLPCFIFWKPLFTLIKTLFANNRESKVIFPVPEVTKAALESLQAMLNSE